MSTFAHALWRKKLDELYIKDSNLFRIAIHKYINSMGEKSGFD